jgi:hypothetical protein
VLVSQFSVLEVAAALKDWSSSKLMDSNTGDIPKAIAAGADCVVRITSCRY